MQLPGPIGSLYAYDAGFTGGVYVSAGRINNDLPVDILTGAGGGPHVRAFSGLSGQVLRDFFAYAGEFLGGVRVAAIARADTQITQIATAAGPSGGAHLRVFEGLSLRPVSEWFAYDDDYSTGLFLAGALLELPDPLA